MIEINKIYNENCLDTMSKMQENYIDLTVTSPPYDNLRDYNGYSFDFENIAKELYRITKIGGVLVWIVNDSTINGSETGTSFKQALFFKEIGFNLHDTMIYAKNNAIPLNHNRYEQAFEYMFVFVKGKLKTFNAYIVECKSLKKNNLFSHTQKDGSKKISRTNTKKNKIDSNIWFFDTGYNKTSKDKIAFKHPAILHEKLAEKHILSWSNEDDIIYDPFGGSGTTAKMCILNNRKYILSEISLEYYNIAKERLKLYENQLRLF